jgi:hypothetical protein
MKAYVRKSIQFGKSRPPMTTQSLNDLSGWMLEKYGPLMGGEDLYAALGFKTYAAFHRARLKGDIDVHVFSIRGRRGLFSLTTDVAAWLQQQAKLITHEEGDMDS